MTAAGSATANGITSMAEKQLAANAQQPTSTDDMILNPVTGLLQPAPPAGSRDKIMQVDGCFDDEEEFNDKDEFKYLRQRRNLDGDRRLPHLQVQQDITLVKDFKVVM